jgi:hypothetical protein
MFLRAVKIHEHRLGQPLLDWEKSLWLEDGALETMLASFESRLGQPWPLGPLRALGKRALGGLAAGLRRRLLAVFGGQGPRL